jgi:hypothetical protein
MALLAVVTTLLMVSMAAMLCIGFVEGLVVVAGLKRKGS